MPGSVIRSIGELNLTPEIFLPQMCKVRFDFKRGNATVVDDHQASDGYSAHSLPASEMSDTGPFRARVIYWPQPTVTMVALA